MEIKLARTLLLTILSLSVLSGCQKGGSADQSQATATKENSDASNPLKRLVPDKVCSDQVMQFVSKYDDNQKQISKLFEQFKKKKITTEDGADYKQRATTQVENCRQIDAQFEKEKIDGCLKSGDTKTKENSIYRSEIQKTCAAVGLWSKKITHKDNAYTQQQNTIADLKFSDEAAKLITSSKDERYFVAEGKVNGGFNNFKTLVQAGTPACFVTNPSQKNSSDLILKYVTDSNDTSSKTDLGFDFNGPRTTIVLQDENSVYSLLCLNVKLANEKNKQEVLQKIFGSSIQLIEKTSTDSKNPAIASADKLNHDVAPADPSAQPVAAGTSAQDKANTTTAQINSAANAIDSAAKNLASNKTVQAGMDALNSGLEKVSTQVNATVDHATEKISAETTKNIEKLEASGSALIEKTKQAAIETGKEVVKEAGNQVRETLKAPFVAVGEKIDAAAKWAVKKKDEVASSTIVKKVIKPYFEMATYIPRKVGGWIKDMFTSDDDSKATTSSEAKTETKTTQDPAPSSK